MCPPELPQQSQSFGHGQHKPHNSRPCWRNKRKSDGLWPPERSLNRELDWHRYSERDTLGSLTSCSKIPSLASAASGTARGLSARGALVPDQLQGKAATYWTPDFVAATSVFAKFSPQAVTKSCLLLSGMWDGPCVARLCHCSLALANRCNFSFCCKP